MYEEHLKMWIRSAINNCRDIIGDLPSVPIITDELDQCLGRAEHELEYALSLVKTGNALNKVNGQ